MLTVHHLDEIKSNCTWWNLPALCQRCHLIIQAKVKMDRIWMFKHTNWFLPYVAGYYSHLQGIVLDEDEARKIDMNRQHYRARQIITDYLMV